MESLWCCHMWYQIVDDKKEPDKSDDNVAHQFTITSSRIHHIWQPIHGARQQALCTSKVRHLHTQQKEQLRSQNRGKGAIWHPAHRNTDLRTGVTREVFFSWTAFPARSLGWRGEGRGVGLLFVGCLTSKQHASVTQGRICLDNCTCCHTEIEVADQTFHLTQSLCTNTWPTSPSADPKMPGAWQSSHWSTNFWVTGMTPPSKNLWCKREPNFGSSAPEADALTARSTRWSISGVHH